MTAANHDPIPLDPGPWSFTVDGEPQGKGRPITGRNKATGGVLVRTPTKTRRYEAERANRGLAAAALREGFEIARDAAWVSTWDGWHVTSPTIEWEAAEKRLAERIEGAGS